MIQVLPISEIFPFENHLRIFQMPETRLIGKSIYHTDETDVTPIPRFWTEYFEKYHAITSTLPQIIKTNIAWFGDYEPSIKRFAYMICVICPAGTPVPDGFEARDMPPMLLAHGTTCESPPEAHNIACFCDEVSKLGYRQTGLWCEFYPYQSQMKNDCCISFTVEKSNESINNYAGKAV